jgi:hypothetical protein
MTTTTRATVYLDQGLHRALRLKSVETARSVSNLINAAVRATLAEDADDIAIARARANEPSVSFESVLKDLKRRGKL